MSWPRSPIIASPHRKDALETAGRDCAGGPAHVPDVVSILTFMCNAHGWGFVSCHVSRSQWALPSPTMGWHEHWDALCRGVDSSWTARHWTTDVRVDHPATTSLCSSRPPRPQTLPVPEVTMPPPAWGTEASEPKANLMPSALRNPPGGDSSTRHTLHDPCHPR